jgi:hypothetical protein
MKKFILLLLLFFPFIGSSQEILLNDFTSLYEYSHIKDFQSDNQINDFERNFKALNYSNVLKDENSISGENYFSVLIMGTPLQVHYFVYLEFKKTKYKISINKFIIEDKRWSPIPIENIKRGKSKWIKKINENIPNIIKSIESNSDWN